MKKKRFIEESDKSRNASHSSFVKLTKREDVGGKIHRKIKRLEMKTIPKINYSPDNKSLLK